MSNAHSILWVFMGLIICKSAKLTLVEYEVQHCQLFQMEMEDNKTSSAYNVTLALVCNLFYRLYYFPLLPSRVVTSLCWFSFKLCLPLSDLPYLFRLSVSEFSRPKAIDISDAFVPSLAPLISFPTIHHNWGSTYCSCCVWAPRYCRRSSRLWAWRIALYQFLN